MMTNQKPSNTHRFPYEWHKKDVPAPGIDYHGTKVFTTFSCGGGSSFGYKLAGYDVIAANDIDKKMREVYLANHKPKHYLLGGVSDLLTADLPAELYDIDVLDGSPPCSVFSTSGLREKGWQIDKKFKEGQAKQILDDLFFQFIELAEKIKPKIIVAENVKGMLIGNAKWYTREVVRRFDAAGYTCQVFLLNGARMGVPQRRERVFFVAHRKEYDLPRISLKFNEKPIPFREISRSKAKSYPPLTPLYAKYWRQAMPGKSVGKYDAIKKMQNTEVAFTINATKSHFHPTEVREINATEETLIGSFPLDYNFGKTRPTYLIGMSVPPVMMAQVADQIFKQWIQPLAKQGILKLDNHKRKD